MTETWPNAFDNLCSEMNAIRNFVYIFLKISVNMLYFFEKSILYIGQDL